MSSDVVRPYNTKLLPDNRKYNMFLQTFKRLNLISSNHFDLLVCLYAAITNKKAEEYKSEKEDHVTADSLCAINWFRPMSKRYIKYATTTFKMLELFKEYSGHEPDTYSKNYLMSNIDSDRFVWVDCRKFAKDFANQMELSFHEFTTLSETLLANSILVLNESTKANWAWGAVSALYGGGDKEDSTLKSKILLAFVDALNNPELKTRREILNHVCESLKYQSYQDMYVDFRSVVDDKGNKKSPNGSMPIVTKFESDDLIGDNQRKTMISSFTKNAAAKASKKPIPYLDILKDHMISLCEEYNVYAWAAAITNSNADVTARNTRNLTFIGEQNTRRKELSVLQTTTNEKAKDILNKINDNLIPEVRYTPAPKHLGRDLANLFEMFKEKDINQIGNEEEKQNVINDCIEQYVDDCRSLNRNPVAALLKHISGYYEDFSAKNFLDGAKLNVLTEVVNRQKAHPTICSEKAYTWISKIDKNRRQANSSLVGWVVPPEEVHKEKIAGQQSMMWVTLTLLDDGKWVKHHIPFADSRYYSEVYAYNPNLPYLEGGIPRQSKFGNKPTTNLTAESQALLANSKHKKANKTFLRAKENITHNVRVSPNTSLCIRPLKDSAGNQMFDNIGNMLFGMQINHRITVGKPNYKIEVGDRFLGFDQNQSENHTYAVLQRVSESSHGTHHFNGWDVKVIEKGKVTSDVVVRDEVYDQLSYEGVPYDSPKFTEWREKRRKFVLDNMSIQIEEGKTFLTEFDKLNKDSLYRWNMNYMKLLRKAIRAGGKEFAKITKAEIFELGVMRFGPMNLGSLSQVSLKMIAAFKGVIQSYFSVSGCIDDASKKAHDSMLFAFLCSADEKRTNKREEKTNRAASFILQKAYSHGCKMIVCEDDLPIADGKVGKAQNADRMDWCARSLAKKVNDGCVAMSICYRAIPAYMSSHQDPFTHMQDKKTSVLRPRFMEVGKDSIRDYHVAGLRRMLNSKGNAGTSAYYREAALRFCEALGVPPELVKNKKTHASELGKHMGSAMLMPWRGGRIYVASKKLTSDAKSIKYCGEDMWQYHADEIAAINIAMYEVCCQTGAFGKKQKKSDELPG